MLKSLCNFLYRINSRKSLWIKQLELCSMVANVNIEKKSIYTDKFSLEDSEILKIVNDSSLTKLRRFIELPYAKAIILSRNLHGSYVSLNDFVSRNEIKPNVLDTFYKSVYNYIYTSKKLCNISTIIPTISIEQIPKTTLGIHVGKKLITWASVTDNFEVLEWDYIQWIHQDLPKYSYDIIKMIEPILNALPTYDSYVTEETNLRNMKCMTLSYYQQQLTVAIMVGLKLLENQRTNNSLPPVNSLYSLKPRVSATFHKLIVGSEIISPNYFMKKIINDNTESSDDELTHVLINDVHKNNYLEADVHKQEEMSWCLLKALTFMRLVKFFTLNAEMNHERE